MASDASALVAHTRKVVYLEDHEIAILRRDGMRTINLEDHEINKPIERIDWEIDAPEWLRYPLEAAMETLADENAVGIAEYFERPRP